MSLIAYCPTCGAVVSRDEGYKCKCDIDRCGKCGKPYEGYPKNKRWNRNWSGQRWTYECDDCNGYNTNNNKVAE